MHKLITTTLTIVAVAALSPFASAQGGDKMAKKTYTGCVQAGEMAGTYMLAHAMADMDGDAMKKDAMQKEMKKDPMAKDAMANMMSMTISSKEVDLSKHVGHKVTVTGTTSEMAMGKPDAMAKPDGMAKQDAMAKPGAMAKPMAPLTVTSLKMVAATCGM